VARAVGSVGVAVAVLYAAGPAAPAPSSAPGAPAATRIEVEVGYAGLFVPGRPVPVRVTVDGDGLARGELVVEEVDADESSPVVVPLEVAGGSAKQVVVVLPAPIDDARFGVTAAFAGASGRGEATADESVELVGLLPGSGAVAGGAEVPAPVPLPMDLGTARFARLDEALLAAPGALGPLGLVAAGPDGLTGLDETARTSLLRWLDTGGQLVVDGAPGDVVEGLPEEWQPVAARVPAGQGTVRAVDGAIGRGDWGSVVEATGTSVAATGSLDRMMFSSEDVAHSLARDSGLKLPGVGWLAGFLGAYVLLVGPVAYLLVRRRRRPLVSWGAVAATALVFTAGAVVGGRSIRADTQAAHTSYVATGPAGGHAFGYLGVVSPSGTDPTVALPADWAVGGYLPPWSDPGFDDGSGTPRRVEQRGDRLDASLGLQAGGYGMLSAWGPVEARGLEVTAVATADGDVTGTVRNTGDIPLDHVLVLVGLGSWGGGTLAPGEEVDWEIDAGDDGNDDWGPPEDAWDEFTGWDTGFVAPDAPVDYALWSDRQFHELDPYGPGRVVAAGWTSDWRPPADLSAQRPTGRTVFTTRAPVTPAAADQAPAATVRRTQLRRDVDFDMDADFGPSGTIVARFDLPPGTDPATPLELVLADMVQQVEVWDGTRWARLPDCGNPEANAGLAGDDDHDRCPLRADQVHDGGVVVRFDAVDDGRPSWPGITVGGVT
jgi:hypothetical protein